MSCVPSNPKSRRGYRRLLSQQFSFNFSHKKDDDVVDNVETNKSSSKSKKKKNKQITVADPHPIVKILNAPTKKATSRPEFLRYLQYVKEAGSWGPDSDRPTIYYN